MGSTHARYDHIAVNSTDSVDCLVIGSFLGGLITIVVGVWSLLGISFDLKLIVNGITIKDMIRYATATRAPPLPPYESYMTTSDISYVYVYVYVLPAFYEIIFGFFLSESFTTHMFSFARSPNDSNH